MKCPSCGHFYDDKASDREGPECADCHEETMNEVKLSAGGGDRRGLARIYIYVGPDGYAIADRRVGPGERRVATFRMWLQRYSDTIWVKVSVVPDLILALRRAPDPVEAEYREAAQAHGEADIEFELCSCDAAAAVDCPHWNATVRTRVRLIAARAARDGAR